MSLPILYITVLFVGLLCWIIYYRTRRGYHERQDAVALGVILACSYVVLTSFLLTLGLVVVLEGGNIF